MHQYAHSIPLFEYLNTKMIVWMNLYYNPKCIIITSKLCIVRAQHAV